MIGRAAAIVVWLAGISAAMAAEPLRLAAADSKPTAFHAGDKPVGILVDLVTEAFRRTGHRVDISLRPWARCLEDARTGAVDGVFSSFKLPERQLFLAFPNEVLITQNIVLFAKAGSTLAFNGNLAELGRVRMGVITGTSYGARLDAALRDGTIRDVEGTNSVEANVEKLMLGRVDVIPSYRQVALDAAVRLGVSGEIRQLSPEVESVPSYLAFTRMRPYQKESDDFDVGLASMKKDGAYEAIFARYVEGSKSF